MRYKICSWDFIVQKKWNCGQRIINNTSGSDIIDVISLNTLPIKNVKNPNFLHLVIFFENGSRVIHDIIEIKTWFEKLGICKEPLTNIIISSDVVFEIRKALTPKKLPFFYRIGIRKRTDELIQNSVNPDFTTEYGYVMVLSSKNTFYTVCSILDGFNKTKNKIILYDIQRILNGYQIREYDYIFCNHKVLHCNDTLELYLFSKKFSVYELSKHKNIIHNVSNVKIVTNHYPKGDIADILKVWNKNIHFI